MISRGDRTSFLGWTWEASYFHQVLALRVGGKAEEWTSFASPDFEYAL